MKTRLTIVLAIVVVLTGAAFSQDEVQTVEMRVYVSWGDGLRPGGNQAGMPSLSDARNQGAGAHTPGNAVTNMDIRITVQGDAGNTLADQSPNGEGYASFNLVGVVVRSSDRARLYPSYRIRVVGSDIDEQILDNIQPGLSDRIVNITLHKKGEKRGSETGGGLVSATSLKIPKNARKEFEKGVKALEDKKLPEARTHFEKATEAYPQYDMALNALGVTLMKLGDAQGGRKSFEQAIAANDKFAAAYVNLARVMGGEKDYEGAANSLSRSLSLEPLNPEALSLLCQYDVMRGKYEEVPALATKLHSVPHDGQALGHYAAATALEQLGQPTEAIAEYTLFMNEDPMSRLSAGAKAAIARLQQMSQAKPQ